MTLKMTTAQVVETSVTVTNSSFQNYIHLHSGQTQKHTSHPVACALKICICSKRLRSEDRKKALLETQ